MMSKLDDIDDFDPSPPRRYVDIHMHVIRDECDR